MRRRPEANDRPSFGVGSRTSRNRSLEECPLAFRCHDEEIKSIAVGFAGLLKPMVETIDRRGLKKHFLRKHLVEVDRFYGFLDASDFKSEAATKCKQRFEKNRDKLFTFLRYDGMPWNNNNAEHAIKAFARLRDVIAGTSTKKGVNEYLTLLVHSLIMIPIRLSLGRGPSGPSCLQRIVGHRR